MKNDETPLMDALYQKHFDEVIAADNRTLELCARQYTELYAHARTLEHILAYAREWIGKAPHGNNCFVSNHYEGDPGSVCNCCKDDVIAAIDNADTAVAEQDDEFDYGGGPNGDYTGAP